MNFAVTLLTEPYVGKTFRFESGQKVRVGRLRGDTQICIPDPLLAPVHFEIECGPSECKLRDLSQATRKHPRCTPECFVAGIRNHSCPECFCQISDMSGEAGVYVNGKKVIETLLQHGDVVVAGCSGFQFAISETPMLPLPENDTLKVQPALTSQQQTAILSFLTKPMQLYAILDAARDPEVLQSLLVHGEPYYSLYDGVEGERLADVAPYLVELPPTSALAADLVRVHWGKSWGVFLYCQSDFKATRRHLRRFLTVEDDLGKKLYFRFYDPRVLRGYLPTCDPAECAEFFGPITMCLVESDEPGTMLGFSQNRASGLRTDVLRF